MTLPLGSLIWGNSQPDVLHKQLAQMRRDIGRLQSRRVNVALLQEISPDLGLIQAGEFRAGNGNAPDEGFTGMRMGYPGFSYAGDTWNLAGVNNDVLQAGLSATDGKIYGGAGAVTIDADGISITQGTNSENSVTWHDAANNQIAGIYGNGTVSGPNDVSMVTDIVQTATVNADWYAQLSKDVTKQIVLRLHKDDTSGYLALYKAGAATLAGLNIGSSAAPIEALEVQGSGSLTGYMQIAEQSAPSTPSSGYGRVYFKSDSKPYALNDGGTEYDLTAGAIIKANLALTAQTADIGATNLLASAPAGTYRVSYTLLTTTADGAAGAVTVTYGWTDGAGATTQASAALPLTATGRTSGVFHVQLASGNITYAVSHGGSYGTAVYALYTDVERLS